MRSNALNFLVTMNDGYETILGDSVEERFGRVDCIEFLVFFLYKNGILVFSSIKVLPEGICHIAISSPHANVFLSTWTFFDIFLHIFSAYNNSVVRFLHAFQKNCFSFICDTIVTSIPFTIILLSLNIFLIINYPY